MLLTNLLSQLRDSNIRIWLENGKLHYNAPQGALTGELLARLKERREELIDFLKQVNSYSAIEPAPFMESYPVTFAQKRLYILSQLEGAGSSYNMSGAIRIEGNLEPDRLAKAFQKLVGRHEAFRTTFALVDGDLVQRIHPEAELIIDYQEVREDEGGNVRNGRDRSVIDRSVLDIIRQFIQPFDLSRAPLLRIKLLKVAPDLHILMYDMSHMISDLMSMSVLVREFTKLYNGESLPDIRIQYKDFAFWQKNSGSDIIQKQEKYWLEQFGGKIPQLDLPMDYLRSSVMNFQGSTADFQLEEALTTQLRQLAVQRKTTLFMTLLAVYNLFLSRLTGSNEVIVGTTIAGRRDAELENMIGMFVNTLPLKNQLDFTQTFGEFLDEVNRNTLKAFDNQDYQYEMLMDKLKIPIDLNRNPLFNTLFNPQTEFNTGHYQFEVGELKFSPYELENQANTFAFDLMILLNEMGNTVKLNCIYRTGLFKPSTIEYLMHEFIRLLHEIALDPGKQLQYYRVFNPHDIQPAKQPITIAATYEEFEASALLGSIVDRFEDQVRLYPNQIAVKVGPDTLSFQTLNQRANQLAQQIRDKQKVSRPVALLFNCSPDMIIGVMGVLKSGQAYLPMDPAYPMERLAYMLSDSGAILVVTDHQNISLASELSNKTGKEIQVIDLSELNPKLAAKNLNLAIPPEQVAYIKYTSGSTGKPKGIPQTHRNVLAFIRRFTNELHINRNDKVAMFSSYSHSAGGIDIFSMLLNGGTLYPFDLKSEGNFRKIADWLIAEGITIFHSVPMVYRYCIDSLGEGEKFDRIRLVVLGGEPILAKDGERLRRYFSKDCVLVNMFGATEVIIGTFGIVDGETEITTAQVPIGNPVEEVKVYLVDEANQEVPVFGVGEIIYESDYLALDYLNLPEKSAQSYTTNPFTGTGRVFRSGDLGRMLSDGRLEFLGRKDFQVKIRGYRVELGEVEAVLNELPGIAQSIVAGFEKGEGDYHLAAYYTVTDSAPGGKILPDIGELRRLLGQKLPDYMIPTYFVHIEQLPLTPTGKVDRKRLPEPEISSIDTGIEYEEPHNEMEVKLVRIWQEVLGIEKVGINDSFFDLGGHSINATSVIVKIHKELNVELPLREIFNNPTIKKLALRVAATEKKIDSAIKPVQPDEEIDITRRLTREQMERNTEFFRQFAMEIYIKPSNRQIKLKNRSGARRYNLLFKANEYPYYFDCFQSAIIETLRYKHGYPLEPSFISAAMGDTIPGLSWVTDKQDRILDMTRISGQFTDLHYVTNRLGIDVNFKTFANLDEEIKYFHEHLDNDEVIPLAVNCYHLFYTHEYHLDKDLLIDKINKSELKKRYFPSPIPTTHTLLLVDILEDAYIVYDINYKYFGEVPKTDFDKSIQGLQGVEALNGHPIQKQLPPYQIMEVKLKNSEPINIKSYGLEVLKDNIKAYQRRERKTVKKNKDIIESRFGLEAFETIIKILEESHRKSEDEKKIIMSYISGVLDMWSGENARLRNFMVDLCGYYDIPEYIPKRFESFVNEAYQFYLTTTNLNEEDIEELMETWLRKLKELYLELSNLLKEMNNIAAVLG